MEQLTPYERNRAAGMSAIEAFLTESTCGEACWTAREDVCRCSCGGKNHGCMRTADGARPNRTAKIDGPRYQLAAVGEHWRMHADAVTVNKANGETWIYADSSRDPMAWNCPAKIRKATQAQLDKWPELRANRDAYNAKVAEFRTGGSGLIVRDVTELWPYLLWVREDIATSTATVAA